MKYYIYIDPMDYTTLILDGNGKVDMMKSMGYGVRSYLKVMLSLLGDATEFCLPDKKLVEAFSSTDRQDRFLAEDIAYVKSRASISLSDVDLRKRYREEVMKRDPSVIVSGLAEEIRSLVSSLSQSVSSAVTSLRDSMESISSRLESIEAALAVQDRPRNIALKPTQSFILDALTRRYREILASGKYKYVYGVSPDDIAVIVRLSPSTVRDHLNLMEEKGLVVKRMKDRKIYYAPASQEGAEVNGGR